MLVLHTPTNAAAEVKGIENATGSGNVTLSGSMTRQAEVDLALAGPGAHVANIGRTVEDME